MHVLAHHGGGTRFADYISKEWRFRGWAWLTHAGMLCALLPCFALCVFAAGGVPQAHRQWHCVRSLPPHTPPPPPTPSLAASQCTSSMSPFPLTARARGRLTYTASCTKCPIAFGLHIFLRGWGVAWEGPARRGYRVNTPPLARPRSPRGDSFCWLGCCCCRCYCCWDYTSILFTAHTPTVWGAAQGAPKTSPYWRPCYFPSPCSKSGRGRPLLPRPPPPRAGGDRSVPMVA